jgi:hypothetical protein
MAAVTARSLLSPVANENAQYYMLTSPFINTFNKEEAEQATRNKELRTPQKIERVLTVPLLTINSVLYRLQNSMNRRIYCQRIRSMGELFSGFEV